MMIVLKLLPGCLALHTFSVDTGARVAHTPVPFGDLVWYMLCHGASAWLHITVM